jgi:hypothetical protein
MEEFDGRHIYECYYPQFFQAFQENNNAYCGNQIFLYIQAGRSMPMACTYAALNETFLGQGFPLSWHPITRNDFGEVTF